MPMLHQYTFAFKIENTNLKMSFVSSTEYDKYNCVDHAMACMVNNLTCVFA